MAIASTYFIKGQIPGVTRTQLLRLYEREILEQGAGETFVREDRVDFSGSASFFPRRHDGKFEGFDNGQLMIAETDTEFLVYLDADYPKSVLFFDVYFEKLRNDLEQELQSTSLQ